MIEMAKKSPKNKELSVKEEVGTTETIEHLAPAASGKMKTENGKSNAWKWIIAAVVLLVLFWYKTNSWPIVAMVGARPVTRWEIEQNLMKTYGKEEVENKITETLVRNELSKMGVTVDQAEVDAKVSEIRASIGEDTNFEELLAGRGMTMDKFKEQLALQMKVEKGLADKVVVSDEEVSQYLEENKAYITATGEAARKQAVDAVKLTKLQEEIGKWIEQLRNDNKVWRAPGI